MHSQAPVEIDQGSWRQFAAHAVNPSRWTAVIPAAGRGSRLGFDRPKILYPVAGRPLVEWLLDFLEPHCARLLFVLSPDGKAFVEPVLERLIPGRFRDRHSGSSPGHGRRCADGSSAGANSPRGHRLG